tara:strand:+ start:926 stop:1450 length:525 start_codon:yes stop_codon:yes gene_type:complete
VTDQAVFAGGCFWCLEAFFSGFPGVVSVRSGYSGGQLADPNYEMVCAGNTGHLECVQVVFDPAICSYRDLVIAFWSQIDPTQSDGQFLDRGQSYMTAIFYANDTQRLVCEDLHRQACELFEHVYTVIRPLEHFYEAEARHQNYHVTYSEHYQLYKRFSGRATILEQIWSGKKMV